MRRNDHPFDAQPDLDTLHELGAFVHGCLCGLHVLGAVYNARRANWWDCLAHVSAVIYDGWAVTRHLSHVRRVAASSTHARV